MDVWEVPQSSRSGLDRRFLMEVGPTRATRLSVRVRPVKRTCQHHDINPFAYQIDMAEFKKED
jgi:hypothetical protein